MTIISGFPRTQNRKRCARIIMAERNLYVKHSSFVNATLWAGNACPPEKRVIIGDGSDRNVTQVLFLEVRDFTIDAL